MILWRYLSSEYACQAFETGLWKLGRIAELNDPMDCRPVLFKRRGSSRPESQQDFMLDHLTESIGLICYSEQIEDPAVWAHYGDDHRGVAFGFHFPQGYEANKVRYQLRRARLYREDLSLRGGADADSQFAQLIGKGWLSKAPGWSFEKEHRHFISLMGEGIEFKRPHYFRRLPWEHLRHVTIGVRSALTVTDMAKLHSKIPCVMPNDLFIAYFKARIDPINNRIECGMPKPL